jgi:SET domain-containing protein
MYKLKVTKQMGRGLYATKAIKKGQVITVCEVIPLKPSDTKQVNETALKLYTFKYSETRDCVVLGDGSIFNHSHNENVSYKLKRKDKRQVMVFTALSDIKAGEQLFTNYNQDVDVNIKKYLK